MIGYFERQMKEINHSIHSLDEKMFRKMVDQSVTTIRNGHNFYIQIQLFMEIWG